MTCSVGSKENYPFRLHHPSTVVILLLISLVVTCELLLGHSIKCITENNSRFPPGYIEANCYTAALYTVPEWRRAEQDFYYNAFASEVDSNQKSYIKYYRWVNLVLLIQAFLFFLPHYLWKNHDNGFINKLVSSVHPLVGRGSVTRLADFLLYSRGKHHSYARVHVYCEILNLVIPVINIKWLVDFFQVTGVPEEIKHIIKLETSDDFAAFYFPSFAKCSFPQLGNPGSSERSDALCSLPLNSLYMYIFVFLLAWYSFLVVFSVICIILILVKSYSRTCRRRLLRVDVSSAHKIAYAIEYSDYFVLNQVRKCLHPCQFEALIKEMELLQRDELTAV